MVVDDEPDILLTVKVNLELSGFRVVPISSGEDALDALGQARPDLLVLDIRLPGISGWDVLRTIRDDPDLRDLPVVVLSAHASPGSLTRAEQLGAEAYVTKPFAPEELSRTVRVALEPS
jgi:two-component system alkaline phosphatase synthesis response regulator PhoP